VSGEAWTWITVAVAGYSVLAGGVGLRALKTRGDDYKKRATLHREQIARISAILHKGENDNP
jgi:hypothetical protein